MGGLSPRADKPKLMLATFGEGDERAGLEDGIDWQLTAEAQVPKLSQGNYVHYVQFAVAILQRLLGLMLLPAAGDFLMKFSVVTIAAVTPQVNKYLKGSRQSSAIVYYPASMLMGNVVEHMMPRHAPPHRALRYALILREELRREEPQRSTIARRHFPKSNYRQIGVY